MKKVLILSEAGKVSGTATWKNGLVKQMQIDNMDFDEINVSSVTSLFSLFKLLQRNVIHTYHISGYSLIFALLGKLLRNKLIFTLHGNFYEERKSKSGFKRFFWSPFHKINILLADKVTVASNYLKNTINSYEGILKHKTIVIPNGIDDTFRVSKKTTGMSKLKPFLLEITNFNYKEKANGVIPLVEAFEKIHAKFPRFNLIILGDGKYLEYFKRKFENDYIHFLGKKDPHVFLSQCYSFVHSTFLDNFPYVLLEAMCYSKPVVAVEIGGIPELLHPESLVKPNSSQLEKKLNKIISEKKFRDKLAFLSNSRIKNFYWKNLIKKYYKIYN